MTRTMSDSERPLRRMDAAERLLEDCGGLHDWFLLETRSVSLFRFESNGVVPPSGGRAVWLRLSNGTRELVLAFEDVARLDLGREPDAIQVARFSFAANGDIQFTADDLVVTARAAWACSTSSTRVLKFGPAPWHQETPEASSLGDGWFGCSACGASWKADWDSEPCPNCGRISRCSGTPPTTATK